MGRATWFSVMILTALLVIFFTLAEGQTIDCQDALAQVKGQRVEPLEATPKLGISYAQATRFKLASLKNTYRLNEVILVSPAVLNTSNRPLFVLHLSYPDLDVRDEKGVEVQMKGYEQGFIFLKPTDYRLLSPNRFMFGSVNLIVGCGKWLATSSSIAPGDKGDRAAFEQDLFTSWGNACIDIKRPGTYTLTAEVRNDHVRISPCDHDAKTAVGTMRSRPLSITVVD